jgi:hypothetical protein
MLLACFFVYDSAVTIDLDGLTAVALLRRDELDLAVAAPVVVPIHKRRPLCQAVSTVVNGRLV